VSHGVVRRGTTRCHCSCKQTYAFSPVTASSVRQNDPPVLPRRPQKPGQEGRRAASGFWRETGRSGCRDSGKTRRLHAAGQAVCLILVKLISTDVIRNQLLVTLLE
jgi:hypothetical protein